MGKRTAAEGRFQVPPHWPKWKKRCGANRSGGRGLCTQWSVVGMPTCKYHGSGGERNKQIGELRYLCWIIAGVPHDMPVEHACRVTLAAFAEAVLNNGAGSASMQMKAALWLTDMMQD